MPTTPIAPWTRYLTLANSPRSGAAPFTSDEMARIAQALDTIAATPEGLGLMQLAYERAGHKHTITPDINNNAMNGEEYGYHIGINPELVERLLITDEHGVARHTSMLAVLVHEIYHAADPKAQPEILVPAYRQAFAGIISSANLEAATRMITNISSGEASALLDHTATAEDLAAIDAQWARLGIAPEARGEFLSAAQGERLRDAVLAAGIFERNLESQNIYPSFENDAVRFTDQFMHKYFGTQEPERRVYDNGEIGEERVVSERQIQRTLSPTRGFFVDPSYAPRGASFPSLETVEVASPNPSYARMKATNILTTALHSTSEQGAHHPDGAWVSPSSVQRSSSDVQQRGQ